MVNQTRKRSGTHASSYIPDTRHQVVDVEKQPHRTHYTHHDHRSSIESDSGDDSLTSSSASSRRPMLNGAASARRSRAPGGYYRVPNRIMRYLCLALFSALVLFILALFRFTITSDAKQVALELPKVAPKPPQWESFPFLKRYHGGIRTLIPRNESVPEYPSDGMEEMAMGSDNNKGQANIETRGQEALMSSLVFNPYPDYDSDEYKKKYGEKRECFLDEQETIRIPPVQHYPGVPRGFPDAVMGSNTMLGIKDDVCFERFGRLGPYGFGYSVRKGGVGAGLEGHREGAERVWDDLPPVDFRHVDWAAAQNRCVALNSHRFKDLPQRG